MEHESGLDALSELTTALARAKDFATELEESVASDSLNRFEVRGAAAVHSLVDSHLNSLGSTTTTIEVELREAASLLIIRSGGASEPTIELVDGDLRSFSGSGDSTELERARDRSDVNAFLRNVDDNCRATVAVQVVNTPRRTGFHWITSVSMVEEALLEDWLRFASAIDAGPRLLIIGDLQSAALRTFGCRIQGLDTTRPQAAELPPPMPSPIRSPDPSIFVEPIWMDRDDVVPASGLIEALNGLARMSIWHSLATSVEGSGRDLTVSFLGARAVTVTIRPAKVASIGAELELLRWTEVEATSARLEFARQALSLAIIDASDVDSAAVPALGTARSLYQISQQGSISQALAARRAALETTWAASRTAATSARDFASKATERTIVQIGVLAGVLVAEVRDALTTKQAGMLLLTLSVVSGASLLVSLRTIGSSAKAYEAELADLREFRDVLGDNDLRRMTETPVAARTRSDLRQARVVALVAYGAAGLAALVVGIALLSHGTAALPPPSPQPTPSSIHS